MGLIFVEQMSTGSPNGNIFQGTLQAIFLYAPHRLLEASVVGCILFQVGKATALGIFLVGKTLLLQHSLEFWLITI